MKKYRIIKIAICLILVGGFVIRPFSSIIQNKTHEETTTLGMYLQSDVNDYTTSLKPETEKLLNEAGLLDSEIKELDSGMVEDIEAGRRFDVSVSYFEETEEAGGLKYMSAEDICQYCMKENSKIGSFFLTDTIKAKEKGQSASGKLRFSIITTYAKNKRCRVKTTWRWVENAKYNLQDVVNVYIDYGSIDRSTLQGTWTFYDSFQQKYFKEEYTYEKNANRMKHGYKGVAIRFEKNAMNKANDCMSVSFEMKLDPNYKNFTVSSDYYHQQAVISFKPSFSISASGVVSFSGSVSRQKKMKKINADCSVTKKY